MADYHTRSMKALQLAGMCESTQEAYTRAVRQLVQFYDKQPEEISEPELEEYFLYRQDESEWAGSTLRIAQAGIKFYFRNVLRVDWHLFSYLSAKRERLLPCILSREEVFDVLSRVSTFPSYAYLSTVYACGLRLSEALSLEISDIDSQRMMLHVHLGKGAKDRYVPLPKDTLTLLRKYWLTHRNPRLLFPGLGRGRKNGPTATKPMAIDTVQGSFQEAREAAGITKRRVTIHTLRHCYATHLLEASVNPHVIQRYMGHRRLETTMAYFHLTQKGSEDAYRIIDSMMKGFDDGRDR